MSGEGIPSLSTRHGWTPQPSSDGLASHQPHLHSLVGLPNGNEEALTASPQDQHRHAAKRKRTSSSRNLTEDERQRVSRACDSCKARKQRCSGTQPCSRCHSQSFQCQYKATHRRGRPVSPPPMQLDHAENPRPASLGQGSRTSNQGSMVGDRQTALLSEPSNQVSASEGTQKSLRNSQEPDETRFEGHYIGPTSGIAFLHRAQRRFRQDFEATTESVGNGNSTPALIFSFGDGRYPDYSTSELAFPNRLESKQLVDKYFDFAIPTYRFLHRATVEGWLGVMINKYENHDPEPIVLSKAKQAVVLLILATALLYREDGDEISEDKEVSANAQKSGILFAASERILTTEPGPIRLQSIQARLAQCLYLMGSSRINQAWYIFGTTTQMILAIGLHRKQYSQSSSDTSGAIEIECRKRIFWSAYTLDRYFSVILGRPRIFRDEDLDQHLPSRLSDTELTTPYPQATAFSKQCVSEAPIFHARLAKIIGQISSDLYPTKRASDTNWMELAERRTAELKAWKESLPAFLEPSKVDPSILILIFQRQSTVLRLAYAHALILANRQSLLSNFADLSRRPNITNLKVQGSLKECIDAANLVVDMVNGLLEQGQMCKAFWFTHYISFCAISTLYVYTLQKSLPSLQNVAGESRNDFIQHFEAAERCQQRIARTTAKTSPFRRYNIILDELKTEVLLYIGKTGSRAPRVAEIHEDLSGERPLERASIGFPGQGREEIDAHGPQLTSHGIDFTPLSDLSAGLFQEPLLDAGIFGPNGELLGWSEFDSCALGWADGLGF